MNQDKKSLRHSSLDTIFLIHIFKFQVWVMHSKGDIHVQKLKVQKYFSNKFATHSG